MADGGANDSAAKGFVELEATGKDGLSWHPCQVSLCPRGLGLIVLHENSKSEEMIADKKEIFARIRVRSAPLQGDDCLSIRQGEHVLATQNSHVNGVFYDARVEKVMHVRHSKRIHCRCSFTIKWLHHVVPEVLTVPASAIMKLATESINLHPTISAFFGMLEMPDALDAMPCSMIADCKNWEMDINVLLEQQIKAISTSTDIPQENILKDVPGHKVDLQGESDGCGNEASLKDSLGTIPFLDNLKGSHGSESKEPIKLILETPPASTPIREELTGSKLLLNPLAARAALASLRSFPQTPELPAWCDEKGDTTLKGKSPNIRSIAKKLFPTSSPLHIVEMSNLSSGAQLNGMEKKNKIGEKKTKLSAEMRLTRSQIQRVERDNGMHESSHMTNNNEKKLRLPDTRRVSRSRVGAEKAEAKEYNAAAGGHVIPEFTKLETFSQSTVAPQNYLSDKLRASASPINGQINTRVTRSRVKGVDKTEVNGYNASVTEVAHDLAPKYCFSDEQKVVCSPIDGETVKNEKSILGIDGKVVDADTQKVNSIQNTEKRNNSKRLTRSSAREDTENNMQPKLKLRKNELTESNASTDGSGFQRSLTSPRATRVIERFAEEVESKKISTRSENSVGSDGGTSKSASSKKPEMRSSPRLRCLRSQNKV